MNEKSYLKWFNSYEEGTMTPREEKITRAAWIAAQERIKALIVFESAFMDRNGKDAAKTFLYLISKLET